MSAWALLVEYDGAGFVGWQRQATGVSVQGVLEAAAAHLAPTPIPGGPITVAPITVAAGRTDAGVHAAGQVVQLTLDRDLAPERLREALNFHLKPHPVVVLRVAPAPPGWSARFSALRRTYRYVILNRRARPALDAGRVWHVPAPLDATAMADGARLLLGRHDFTSFRASACQANSPLRTLDRLDVARDGERIVIAAAARSFLHHQVRNMVGSLRLVGSGQWPPSRMAAALAARDRAAAGPTAPAAGLCLMEVGYNEDPFAAPGATVG